MTTGERSRALSEDACLAILEQFPLATVLAFTLGFDGDDTRGAGLWAEGRRKEGGSRRVDTCEGRLRRRLWDFMRASTHACVCVYAGYPAVRPYDVVITCAVSTVLFLRSLPNVYTRAHTRAPSLLFMMVGTGGHDETAVVRVFAFCRIYIRSLGRLYTDRVRTQHKSFSKLVGHNILAVRRCPAALSPTSTRPSAPQTSHRQATSLLTPPTPLLRRLPLPLPVLVLTPTPRHPGSLTFFLLLTHVFFVGALPVMSPSPASARLTQCTRLCTEYLSELQAQAGSSAIDPALLRDIQVRDMQAWWSYHCVVSENGSNNRRYMLLYLPDAPCFLIHPAPAPVLLCFVCAMV